MHRQRIRAHCEKLSELERGRINELKKADWANGRIARHMGRSDAAIRRFWQECEANGRFQRHAGSGRPRATEDREDRLIFRSAITVSDSSLPTIRHTTPRIRVPTMTIHRQLIEQNLRSYRQLRLLPFTLARCRAILQ
ncbi:HTH_Tnp_Tc3_2 domain-containing protein [Trichonephila clavipes]|nr:HTH_Tnp_Tc3_2 domain-containing protein [Trichonephila clavipes]